MTEWKTVPGFSNYECNQAGQVRSKARYISRNSGSYNKPAVYLTPTKHGTGYRYFMRGEVGAETVTPQKIIYITWVGTIPNGYCVVVVDNSRPASVDNIALKWIGVRDYSEHGKVGEKKSPWKMEGFCKSMADVLKMRWAA